MKAMHCSSCAGCSSGCGSSCSGCSGCTSGALDHYERALLLELAQTPFLPVVQFQRREFYFSTPEPLEPSPVYLHDGTEDTPEVELTSLALRKLASRGYLSLDASLPLSGCDYVLYQTSALRQRLAALHPGYTIVVKRGSMALTAAGQDAIDDLEF
ncbi:MAG: hypothetical protein ACI4PM_03750 [Butyricicoccus sp.]